MSYEIYQSTIFVKASDWYETDWTRRPKMHWLAPLQDSKTLGVQSMTLASTRLARKAYFRIPFGSRPLTYKFRSDSSKFTISTSSVGQETCVSLVWSLNNYFCTFSRMEKCYFSHWRLNKTHSIGIKWYQPGYSPTKFWGLYDEKSYLTKSYSPWYPYNISRVHLCYNSNWRLCLYTRWIL